MSDSETAVASLQAAALAETHGCTGALQGWSWQQLGVAAQPDVLWSAQLLPGASLWLDPCGAALEHWVPAVLAQAAKAHQQGWACAVCSLMHTQLPWPQNMSVHTWVQQWARLWPDWSAPDWQRHVQGLQLDSHLHKPREQLSAGTWRKCALAAVLASHAQRCLIEAPVAGLDASSRQYVWQAMARWQEAADRAAAPRYLLVVHGEVPPSVPWRAVLQAPQLAGL